MRNLLLLAGAFCAVTVSAFAADKSLSPYGWEISQTGRNFSFDTATGLATSKGVQRAGLVSVTKRAGREAINWWEPGGYRPTITLDGETLIDGRDTSDVSRVSGFRMDRKGSYVRLAINKGPKAKVRLIQDGKVALTWPRLQIVNVLSYDAKQLVVASFNKQRSRTEFFSYPRNADGEINKTSQTIGVLEDCAMLSAKVLTDGIALQVFCNPANGSDIYFLNNKTGEIGPLRATEADDVFGFELHREKGAVSILSISGTTDGRQAYHAITGALLSGLGEPMAQGTDEAGKLSWSETYRLRVLAQLYRKTGHPVFAELANGAMSAILSHTNRALGIGGPFNPSCGWASRIYSTDRQTPVSFMINQAMISSALLQVAEDLGVALDPQLDIAIYENAQCLVRAYEPHFDESAGLYRIPRGAPFRYDGVWAPWNWHMTWAKVLEGVGERTAQTDLVSRSHAIAKAFVESWTLAPEGALWRYWVPAYYDGWSADDRVSVHRPSQKKAAPRRYEDINHAGISLLGLSGLNHRLNPTDVKAVQHTLDRLLAEGSVLPRDLDGNGPRSPRWLPGAGWHAFATQRFDQLYAGLLPGAVSSDQHLAYAQLFDPSAKFELNFELSVCQVNKCATANKWSFGSVKAFLNANPLFSIRQTEAHANARTEG